MTELPILYRDAHLVAVDKPAKLLVHRNEWARPGEPFALQIVRDQLGQRVNLVHRLDRATSGVLLLGLTAEATTALGQAFAERRVDKRYVAVVRGHPPDAFTIDRPLTDEGTTREARTDCVTVARGHIPVPIGRYPTARYALLEVRPHTGRRHQIRRHLAGMDHPIIGDVAHGDRHHNKLIARLYGVRRLLLHADSIRLVHPVTGAPLTIRARAPLASAPLRGSFDPQTHS